MKPNIIDLNKQYNHILTKPGPVPFCTQTRFTPKTCLNLMLRLPACASKYEYVIFSNINFVSDSRNKQEQYNLLRFGGNAIRHKMRARNQLLKFQYSE